MQFHAISYFWLVWGGQNGKDCQNHKIIFSISSYVFSSFLVQDLFVASPVLHIRRLHIALHLESVDRAEPPALGLHMKPFIICGPTSSFVVHTRIGLMKWRMKLSEIPAISGTLFFLFLAIFYQLSSVFVTFCNSSRNWFIPTKCHQNLVEKITYVMNFCWNGMKLHFILNLLVAKKWIKLY